MKGESVKSSYQIFPIIFTFCWELNEKTDTTVSYMILEWAAG